MASTRSVQKVVHIPEGRHVVHGLSHIAIGNKALPSFSPFLRLDYFSMLPGEGCPDHPHRGLETITYILQGGMDHEDFTGKIGTLGEGDVQIMTAGRGIVHAEMPRQDGGRPTTGFQLWVELPQPLKDIEPSYRDIKAHNLKSVSQQEQKLQVTILSGTSYGISSPLQLSQQPTWILDVTIKPGGQLVQEIPSAWNVFAYTFEGTTCFGQGKESYTAKPNHCITFERGGLQIIASVPAAAEADGRFMLFAGEPLEEGVVQSLNEVQQALADVMGCVNGFERLAKWKSNIGRHLIPAA